MNRQPSIFGRVSSIMLAGALGFSSAIGLAQGSATQKGKPVPKLPAGKKVATLTEEQKVIHLLDRITFGPRPGDVERVLQIGWEKYLDEQLRPERIADQVVEQKLRAIPSIHMTSEQLAATYPPPQVIRRALEERGIKLPDQPGSGALSQPPEKVTAEELTRRREVQRVLQELGYKLPQQLIQELQQAKLLRAVYSERQLQEVMTDFWMNHFNVFAGKGADRWLITAYERDVIRPRVLGKFEDLLRATAQSPAMLFYLDNWLSASPNARIAARPLRLGERLRRLNQVGRQNNLRAEQQRELMLRQLQQRRVRGLNENYAREIMELHTLGVDGGYTQKDVQEVARCFTGWTIRNPRGGGEFYFNPAMHDEGEKIVLGTKIPAGGGIKDGEMVIKLLAHHPSTARFIATKLARKFVSDNPPPSVIERAAKVFLRTEGDIREVVRSILTSPEFWSVESYRAKIKTPFEMTVSAVRALGADTNGGPLFHRWIAQMGEPLFMCEPPTGYDDTAERWVNTGALLARMNFALALAANRIPGTRVNLDKITQSVGEQPEQVAEHFVKLLLHGNVSPQTRAVLDQSLRDLQLAQTEAGEKRTEVAKIVGLILGSSEFQRQ